MRVYTTIGQSVTKVDGREKVTGRTVYAGDEVFPDLLYVKVARSDRPHAEILEIDLSSAKNIPGVVGVWTAHDLPGANATGTRIKDESVLCSKRVRRVGDPVVLIAAKSLRAANSAKESVSIGYRDLPAVFDPEEALRPEAPRIHESGNLLFEKKMIKGDVEAALSKCAYVITNTYRTQRIEHSYLEPEAGTAYMDGKKLTVKLPTKHAHFEQDELAKILGLDRKDIRVICAPIGGYFGDKQGLSPGYYAAIVTRLTGFPAQMVYERRESFEVSTKRHPYIIQMTTGADKEGHLEAVKVDILVDTGAYASYGPSIIGRGVVHAVGPYRVKNIHVKGRLVYTNNPVCGSMRGFGVPQVAIACESQMDLLAEAVGKDPFEIRRINCLQAGEENASGQTLKASVGLTECLGEVERIQESLPPHPREIDPQYLTGWGLAIIYYGIGLTGLPNPGVAQMSVEPGEKVQLCVGVGDGGQGAFTTLLQIASENLGLSQGDFNLLSADTLTTPNSGTSTASRITYVVGRAVTEACHHLAGQVGKKVAANWGVMDLVFEDGHYHCGVRKISFREAVDTLVNEKLLAEGIFDPPTTPTDKETGLGSPYATYAFAAHAAQVSVDRETGQVNVLRIIASHDVGKMIHPVHVYGQVQGGAMMGLGYGLLENVIVKKGRILNPGFRAYLIPSSMEVPEFHISVVECPEPTGPYGAKGVGEPSLLPTAPAIHNAVARATGQYLFDNPVAMEDVWRALS
ncbi:MAG: xanthine dehydrogenase family protein molybdopterin-binding subunit [Deltaproteobacteria bacterium]|nr:xanthine dehydrogenase family protein molybdopterin-binding subunit [Deltaproteobacteria bacterium]